jgi:hypothetical protein
MPVLCREVQDGAGRCREVQLQSDTFRQPLIIATVRRSCFCPSILSTATLALQVRLSISLNVVDLVANYRHLAG